MLDGCADPNLTTLADKGKEMAMKFHLSQSVRGLLAYPDRELDKARTWITHDDGQPFASVNELRTALLAELEKGHEVFPYGECSNFDEQHGCLGHQE